jgi:tetratricopeptide (TPR) repeat protein
MNHNDFNNCLNKINEMKNINSNVKPNEFNDACLINLEAFILSEKLEDYTNAFKKVKQALQLSNSDSTIIRNYQIIGIKYIFEIFKKNNYDECESLIDKEYLQQYFIEDKYKNECFFIKGVIYFSRKDYEKAFDSLYKALKYYKNNNNKKFENCQGGLINSGINIHKKYIIDKKFQNAKESYNKVTEIITDDIMLNKYKIGCLLNNLNLNRWEEAYELIESLNIEYLDEEEKIKLNKLKVIIIINIISE